MLDRLQHVSHPAEIHVPDYNEELLLDDYIDELKKYIVVKDVYVLEKDEESKTIRILVIFETKESLKEYLESIGGGTGLTLRALENVKAWQRYKDIVLYFLRNTRITGYNQVEIAVQCSEVITFERNDV
jgi:hypothetical protein